MRLWTRPSLLSNFSCIESVKVRNSCMYCLVWDFSSPELLLPLTYKGEKWKLAFTAVSLQIFWQKFYRNVPWVVLYKTYLFYCKLLIWLVAMATRRQNLRKDIKKTTPQKLFVGLSWNFAELFLTIASTKILFGCYGNLKFSIDLQWEKWK